MVYDGELQCNTNAWMKLEVGLSEKFILDIHVTIENVPLTADKFFLIYKHRMRNRNSMARFHG